MKKILFILCFITAILVATPQTAWAHVVVKPSEVPANSFQTFVIGVPSEKNSATINVRLVLPHQLKHVKPNLKPGWSIEIKKDDATSSATEIIWSKGNIPPDFRDEFVFSAQVPNEEQTLSWPVYQTYADGSVMSWTKTENTSSHAFNHESGEEGPASSTKIQVKTPQQSPTLQEPKNYTLPEGFLIGMVMIALLLSVISLVVTLQIRSRSSL